MRARLSAEDLEDIKAGDIPVKTVQALEAAAIAREAEALKEFFEEHAGILEYDAGLPRAEAQLKAAKLTATLARNRRYAWASLCEALRGCPEFQPLLIDDADEVKVRPPTPRYERFAGPFQTDPPPLHHPGAPTGGGRPHLRRDSRGGDPSRSQSQFD